MTGKRPLCCRRFSCHFCYLQQVMKFAELVECVLVLLLVSSV